MFIVVLGVYISPPPVYSLIAGIVHLIANSHVMSCGCALNVASID